ncbi:MAG: FGGY family carbohydrate kinase, partial [Oscillospiraceae bacterium]
MSDKYFIGVDSGSQSTKVYIFNQKGEEICTESMKIKPMIMREKGFAEHPEDDTWDTIKHTLKGVMSKFKGDISDIQGLGLCTIRCCRTFMKKDGTLQAPIMSWMDVRAYNKFEDNEDIAYTCAPSGYITHRLTGEFKDTVSNTFQSQFPIDLDTWSWSEDESYFNSFLIPKEKLLKLQMPGTILGYITEKASKETGLPKGLPVVGTANDKAVEGLGAGLIEKNVGLISLGTYITSMVHGNENAKNTTNYWTNFSCIPNEYLYESSGIRRGMWHVSWFKGIIGEECEVIAKSQGLSMEEYLEKEAIKTPIGADGLLTMPDWLAPADKLYKKGYMIGF